MSKARRVSRAEWSTRVARWEKSGLSCEEFSRQEGISPGRLRWWRWELQQERPAASEPRPSPPAFVELVARVPPAPMPIEVAVGGAVMRVPAGFDEDTVARLLRVLAGEHP